MAGVCTKTFASTAGERGDVEFVWTLRTLMRLRQRPLPDVHHSPDAPLAVYRDRLLQVSREFRLYSDRVVVDARWLGGKRYRNSIPLAGLNPKPTQAMIRQRLWKRTFSIGLLCVAAAVVFNRPGYESLQPWLINLLYGFAMFCGVLTLVALPKVLFVRFLSRIEKTPGLDIAKAGPEKQNFETFVEAVRRQIRRS